MKRRAALYARAAEGDGSSGQQLAKLRSFAHAREWETLEFLDEGISVDSDRKPALDALLLAVRTGTVGVVVCTALDRLVATPQELMVLMQEFESWEVDVEVIE